MNLSLSSNLHWFLILIILVWDITLKIEGNWMELSMLSSSYKSSSAFHDATTSFDESHGLSQDHMGKRIGRDEPKRVNPNTVNEQIESHYDDAMEKYRKTNPTMQHYHEKHNNAIGASITQTKDKNKVQLNTIATTNLHFEPSKILHPSGNNDRGEDNSNHDNNDINNVKKTVKDLPLLSDKHQLECPETYKDHLVSSQIEVCKKHPESLSCVTTGARMALSECQQQFKHERWNCSSTAILAPARQFAFERRRYGAGGGDRGARKRKSDASTNIVTNYNHNNNEVNKKEYNGGRDDATKYHPHIMYAGQIEEDNDLITSSQYEHSSNDNFDESSYHEGQSLHGAGSSSPELNLKVINILSKTLEKGTKESAFIYATASAAVVHAVTKSCSAGNLTDCTCRTPLPSDKILNLDMNDDSNGILGASNVDTTTPKNNLGSGDWKWGGCSDNVDYGISFSRVFVDAPDREKLKTLLKYFGSSVIEIPTRYKNASSDTTYPKIYTTDKNQNGAALLAENNNLFPIIATTIDEENATNGSAQRYSQRFYIAINETAPIFSYPYKRPNKQIVRHMVNLHNNQMGRKVVNDLIVTRCRCHGISGSCELKTCWRTMPPFSVIGSYIKDRYERSVRVAPKLVIKQIINHERANPEKKSRWFGSTSASTAHHSDNLIPNDKRNLHEEVTEIDDIENSILLQRRHPLRNSNNNYNSVRGKTGQSIANQAARRANTHSRPGGKSSRQNSVVVTELDLVHLDKSPNYCNPDPGSGIIGTRGRECKIDSRGPDSCERLCCGRGYVRNQLSRTERCNCKFHWCCYVECSNCTTEIFQFTCK